MMKNLPLLGKLPEQWQTVEFGKVLDGGTRNGIYKPKPFHGSGDKIVNMGELFAYPRLLAVPMKRLQLSNKEREHFGLRVGDLLFARRSLVAEGAGKCSIVCEVSEPTVFESSIIRARPDSSIANSLFLYYLFNSTYGFHILDSIRRHVAVAGITGKDLLKLIIPLPPPYEQHAIAHILSSLDDKIELNRKMSLKLEALAQALFKTWFVDFDPVHAKAEGRQPYGMDMDTAALFPGSFEDSQMGKIPEGWRMGILGDIAEIVMGQSPPGETYNDLGEGLPFYQGIRDFGFRFPTRRIYCTAPTRFADRGDVLLSVRAPVGSLNVAIERCVIGRGVAALRLKAGYGSFLYYLLKATQLDWKRFEGDGTVFSAVAKDDVHGFPIIVPGQEIMSWFSILIKPFDDYIESKEHESSTLMAIRDALLPKLISGEIRVRDAETLVGAIP